jgi:hypothetical protein
VSEEQDKQYEQRIHELFEAMRLMRWVALGIALASLVAAVISGLVGQFEVAGITGFLALLFGLMALGNWLMYDLMRRPDTPTRESDQDP